MCVNFVPPQPELLDVVLGVLIQLNDTWPTETWKDYAAPIIRADETGRRSGVVATYGMVPRRHIPEGVKVFDTMNARAETIGERRSFSSAWRKTQLCAVPMMCFYEPSHETGKAERYAIGMHDDALFSVAGLWREWGEPDGTIATSFTQITINADEHPLMKRFHRAGDEKRALVVIRPDELDAWLSCRDPEVARSFLRPFPAEEMKARPAPLPPRARKRAADAPAPVQTVMTFD